MGARGEEPDRDGVLVTFEEALAFGKDGEERVAAKLVQHGLVVSPVYQYENHDRAPVLLHKTQGGLSTLTHPDLAVFGKACFFAEVKRKQRWVDFVPDRGLETGCDLKHWRHYLAVSQRCQLPVWLFFIHEVCTPLGVYVGEVSKLAPHIREWNGRTPDGRYVSKPLALFPKSTLTQKWSLTELGERAASAAA